MKNRIKRMFLSFIAVLLMLFLLVKIMQNSARACDLYLDQGIAWVDENVYYMPAEVVEFNEKTVEFRGSNGIIYAVNIDDFCCLDGVKMDDFQWLLTMDSKGSHYWWDDEILAFWRG